MALVVSGDCGGAAITDKVALARQALARARDRCGFDIVSIGDLLPSFSLDRTRAVLYKYLVRTVRFGFRPIAARH